MGLMILGLLRKVEWLPAARGTFSLRPAFLAGHDEGRALWGLRARLPHMASQAAGPWTRGGGAGGCREVRCPRVTTWKLQSLFWPSWDVTEWHGYKHRRLAKVGGQRNWTPPCDVEQVVTLRESRSGRIPCTPAARVPHGRAITGVLGWPPSWSVFLV